MSLSVIIVNYKSATLISACINSALQFSSANNFEWIVVDNNSKDESRQLILNKFPFVKWIDMGYNSGFARANNRGILESKNEVVLLLNPDTLILDDSINLCFQRFINSRYAGCSVQLLNEDKTPQITGNFVISGALNNLLPLPYLGALLRYIAFKIRTKRTNVVQASCEQEVDWINGAFLMVKKSVIKFSGLLDEDFFLFAEEAEWCSRLLKSGPLCVYGGLNIIHLQGETINLAANSLEKGYQNLFDKKGLQIIVSNHLRIRKQFGVFWFLFHLIIYTIEIPIFIIGSILFHCIKKQNPFKDRRLIVGYIKNIFTLWILTPILLLKRPYFYKML